MKILKLALNIYLILLLTQAVSANTLTGGLGVDWITVDGINHTLSNVTAGTNITITWSNQVATISSTGGGSSPCSNCPNATVATNKATWDTVTGKADTSHTMASHSDDGTMATQNANLVTITGGNITGQTRFNITDPIYFTKGFNRSSIFYINVSDSDLVQNDVFFVEGYNRNPEGSDHYTTGYRFEMTSVSGGDVDGVQGVGGITWATGTSKAKSLHGTAADIGSGSGAIAGVIGQVFPGDGTVSVVAMQPTCSGNYAYSGSTLVQNQCRGIQFGSSGADVGTPGVFDIGILSQQNYTQSFMIIDNMNNASNVPFVQYRNSGGYPLHIVDSKGYISIGTTNYAINGTYPMNNPVGAVDVNASVADDPIADTWRARASGSKQKIIKSNISKNERKYVNQTKKWLSSVWVRKTTVTDGEVLSSLGRKYQVIPENLAFDSVPDKIWIDKSDYNLTYSYNSTTGEPEKIISKIPITNYSTSYYYDSNGSIHETRMPVFQSIPTGKMVKKLKPDVKFNELDGKFYQEVQYSSGEIETKREQLRVVKEKLPKYSKERVGGLIDDINVPEEIIDRDESGTIVSYDLEAMSLYLFEVTREQSERIDDLENKYENLNKSIKP